MVEGLERSTTSPTRHRPSSSDRTPRSKRARAAQSHGAGQKDHQPDMDVQGVARQVERDLEDVLEVGE